MICGVGIKTVSQPGVVWSGCVVYGRMLAAGYGFRLLLVFIDVCLV